MTREKIKAMPKVELHCHLDGSLPMGMLQRVLDREVSKEEVQVSSDCPDLAQYLEKFDLPLSCLQTAQGLQEAALAFMLSLVEENIVYVEVRFAPLLSAHPGLSTTMIMESVIAGMEEGKEHTNIEYGVIACAMRHHSQEDNIQMLKDVAPFYGKGLCAVDLAGNEAAFPMKEFQDVFAVAKELGLPFTIHAGECGSVENVVDSIACGAKRIGHGIALSKHKEAQEMCRLYQVGIELCPTSNLQTKAVSCMEDYPFNEFLENDLLITVNTDNRTVSNTTCTDELAFLQEYYQLSDETLIQLQKNAILVSFAPQSVKDALIDLYWR